MKIYSLNPPVTLRESLHKSGIEITPNAEENPAILQSAKDGQNRSQGTLILWSSVAIQSRADFREQVFAAKANLGLYETEEKRWLAVTMDGAEFFPEEVGVLVKRLLTSRYYQSKLVETQPEVSPYLATVVRTYPRFRDGPRVFGTFAVRTTKGFFTTTRGKIGGEERTAWVESVDHEARVVRVSEKATLNAPLLDKLLTANPQVNFLVHGHEIRGQRVQGEYQFPGTTGDLTNVATFSGDFVIELPQHGYVAGFQRFRDYLSFVNTWDWRRYREVFPSKYLADGGFDEFLGNQGLRGEILEVGGGRQPAKVLAGQTVDTLDPFVEASGSRFHYQSYDRLPRCTYDFIILRGSFNYLSRGELTRLKRALKPGGRLLANTFVEAPGPEWSQRKLLTLAGQEGWESVRTIEGIVEHRWQLGEEDITHWFYVRSAEWLTRVFPGVKLLDQGKSRIVDYVNE